MALCRQLLPILVLLLGQLALGIGHAQQPSPPAIAESPFLQHMPVNSERRCVGVCAVSEALLEGRPQTGDEPVGDDPAASSRLHDPAVLAHAIYVSLTGETPVTYPRTVRINGESLPIESPSVMVHLSTLVADMYRADFQRVTASSDHAYQLALAQRRFVPDGTALLAMLRGDPDRTAIFIGTGERTFPDGHLRPTYHAFLLSEAEDGRILVFDPNAPGQPWPCTIRNTPRGVQVAWTSPYRDTGQTTHQQYRIAGQQQYFRTLFASARRLPGSATFSP
ncbi:hypothetical protein Mal4_56730 [Maioricimonas rarisocia]|uniref:Uncharacterized protein n=1 Tax=Maioricimonas rarisocia TaxID=2528026 RepID=A0A517ZFP4_9PLAN|nr:hypothetical protein [Maioricimonas rarisocia]QDU41307.1 hypothetical protein Mal4_56730 [Maioricimonas rarisocia]